MAESFRGKANRPLRPLSRELMDHMESANDLVQNFFLSDIPLMSHEDIIPYEGGRSTSPPVEEVNDRQPTSWDRQTQSTNAPDHNVGGFSSRESGGIWLNMPTNTSTFDPSNSFSGMPTSDAGGEHAQASGNHRDNDEGQDNTETAEDNVSNRKQKRRMQNLEASRRFRQRAKDRANRVESLESDLDKAKVREAEAAMLIKRLEGELVRARADANLQGARWALRQKRLQGICTHLKEMDNIIRNAVKSGAVPHGKDLPDVLAAEAFRNLLDVDCAFINSWRALNTSASAVLSRPNTTFDPTWAIQEEKKLLQAARKAKSERFGAEDVKDVKPLLQAVDLTNINPPPFCSVFRPHEDKALPYSMGWCLSMDTILEITEDQRIQLEAIEYFSAQKILQLLGATIAALGYEHHAVVEATRDAIAMYATGGESISFFEKDYEGGSVDESRNEVSKQSSEDQAVSVRLMAVALSLMNEAAKMASRGLGMIMQADQEERRERAVSSMASLVRAWCAILTPIQKCKLILFLARDAKSPIPQVARSMLPTLPPLPIFLLHLNNTDVRLVIDACPTQPQADAALAVTSPTVPIEPGNESQNGLFGDEESGDVLKSKLDPCVSTSDGKFGGLLRLFY